MGLARGDPSSLVRASDKMAIDSIVKEQTVPSDLIREQYHSKGESLDIKGSATEKTR